MGYKVKKIYVGTQQVRPKDVFEYSYDFRNKSISILENDGWTFFNDYAGVQFNSNGMYKTSSGYKSAFYPINISTARKVTLIGHLTKGYSDIDAGFGFRDTNQSYWLSCAITTGYTETIFRISDGTSNTTLKSYGAMAQGSYTITIIIDFVNKTLYFSYGTNSYTYNLSDTEIGYLRGSNCMWAGVCKNINNYIPDISIKIEG